ncbi:hypothetical protein [Roseicella aquatilis]|uniref:Uncharacterized protein n=1 Tax=Roseicella aquatilis TaxID=2527868 RepID=A0A4R4DUI3_9PROT|nr:hypothetical protein [Roseicella aquatilis]TCZ65545.1 hypothetical protein EXY23_05075 [Roseicella aquatilis]
MTSAQEVNQRAAEKGSGQATASNAGGTATGPGGSSASAQGNQTHRDIDGSGSAEGDAGRPGHKASG